MGLLSPASTLSAQSVPQAFPSDYHHWLIRNQIKYELGSQIHSAIRPCQRLDFFDTARQIDSSIQSLDRVETQWLQKVFEENNDWWVDTKPTAGQVLEPVDSQGLFYGVDDKQGRKPHRRVNGVESHKPFLRTFYKTPAHLFEVDRPGIQLKVNPLLRFAMGSESGDDDFLFWNQRGLSIRGRIDDKVYFHTSILESQARYPSYVRAFTQQFDAVPRAGFYKDFNSSIFSFDEGVDFLIAKGFVGLPISRHINIELGHGRHFIGNGIRSLFLSDFSNDYFYMRLNTRVWKLHYQNIFGELIESRNRRAQDRLLPKKYFAAHYLSFKPSPNFSIGLFETVVFARENQFELQYLNPIILYRTVEGAIGSPDNVLVGIDLKWNLPPAASLYAQFILDEFNLGEIRNGSGWWGNKYGLQLGARYIDALGIDHLDLQAELNVVRPYTYTHRDQTSNYSAYNQALAHPLGANFREVMMRARYQPLPKLVVDVHAMFAQTGADRDSMNYGGNILLSSNTRVSDVGNKIGQGIATDIQLVGLNVSYEVKRNFYLDFLWQYRRESNDLPEDQSSSYIGAGVRWNLGKVWLEF